MLFWIWLIGAIVLFLVGGLPAIEQNKDDPNIANELVVLYLLLGIFWPVILVGGAIAFVGVKVADYRESRKLRNS